MDLGRAAEMLKSHVNIFVKRRARGAGQRCYIRHVSSPDEHDAAGRDAAARVSAVAGLI